MARYKLRNNTVTKIDGSTYVVEDILDQVEDVTIPKATGNRHYEDYLEWVAAGNTPEAAD